MSEKKRVLGPKTVVNREIFQKLCDEHGDILYRFLYSRGVRPDDIEDLIQKTLLLLWVKRKKISPGKFVSFMLGIAHRILLEYRRRRYQEPSVSFDEDIHSQHGGLNQKYYSTVKKILAKEDNIILKNALNRLPPRMREVIELMYFEGHSAKDTATKMGIGVQTVYNYEKRVLERVAREVRTSHTKKPMVDT